MIQAPVKVLGARRTKAAITTMRVSTSTSWPNSQTSVAKRGGARSMLFIASSMPVRQYRVPLKRVDLLLPSGKTRAYSKQTRIWSGLTASFGATSIDFMIPDDWALILISIFIASRTRRRSFTSTCSPDFTCRRSTTPANGLRHTLDSSTSDNVPGLGAVGNMAE